MGLRVVAGHAGIWRITGTVAGRRIRKSAKTRDLRAAKFAAQAIERRIWEGLATGRSGTLTFEAAALSYMQAGGETRFLAPLIVHFAGAPVRDIRPGNIEDAARALYPGAMPSTWNRQVVTPARAVINHAAERGWCPPLRVRRFPETRPARRAADRAWLEAFMAHAPAELAALALFMFTTGARISEALAIRRGDIEGRKCRLQTKTGARVAILSRETMLRLAALPAGSRTVFRYGARSSIYNHWYGICDAAGIERLPPHQAGRHSFATEMIVRHRIDPSTTAELGGWKNPRLLLDRYAHAENLDRVVDEVFGAPAPGKGRSAGS
jgi:integrase